MRYCWVQVWPNLGLHWAMVAKLEALLDNLPAACRDCREAVMMLGVTHPTSSVLQDTRALESQLQCEMSSGRL